MSKRTCHICKQEKPLTEFYRFKSGRKKGDYGSYCRECDNSRKRGQEKERWRKRVGFYKRPKIKKHTNAKVKLQIAIQKGQIIQCKCGICNSINAEGHHPDYNKPLEVIWLCGKHHREWHRNHPKPKG